MTPDLATVCRLLEQDAFLNLVTLKMLNAYAASMSFELRQDGNDWALLSLLPVGTSEWDRKTYPDCEYVAFINGNSDHQKLQLLECLPKGQLVLKTADKVVQENIARTRKAKKVLGFYSFTRSAGEDGRWKMEDAGAPGVVVSQSGTPDERAWEMFRSNGYDDTELARYFNQGAQWFGIEKAGDLAGACFVFQNYKQIWEIAGVFTQPAFRRQGLGRANVMAALNYLAASNLVPRYQVRWDNAPSLELARACGLEEFLRMEHFLLAAGEGRGDRGECRTEERR